MAKRAHLQRDLGWGTALVVLLAVTTVRAGMTDRFATDAVDTDLFERHVHGHHRRHVRQRHTNSRLRHRSFRRLAQVRSAAVLTSDLLQAIATHPADAVTVRWGQPACAPRGRRSWDTGEWGDRRVEVEGRCLQQLTPVPSGSRGRALAWVSASTPSRTDTPPSTSASTFDSWSSSTSSNRSPRSRGAQR
jgi:hypothetical protein